MADLIIMEDGLPIFNAEYKVIPEFKKIIVDARKDNSYHGQRDLATRQFAYIWFMEDYRSTFKERYPDGYEEERDEVVRKRLQLEDYNLLKDELFLKAREIYREDNETLEIMALENALIALKKTVMDLRALAVNADANSKSVARTPAGIIKTCRELDDMIANVKHLRQQAKKGESTARVAGKKSKGLFEDPAGVDRNRRAQ